MSRRSPDGSGSFASITAIAIMAISLVAGVGAASAQTTPPTSQQSPAVPAVSAGHQQSVVVTLARPVRDRLDYWTQVAQIATPLGAIVGLIGVIVTLLLTARNWKLTYFTKEWSTLIQFLHENAKYMERSATDTYKTSFTGSDAVKYELVARLCIGYLDDLYFLRSRRVIHSWFRGSVSLLAGTHRKWLEDHRDAYDDGFYAFVMCELQR